MAYHEEQLKAKIAASGVLPRMGQADALCAPRVFGGPSFEGLADTAALMREEPEISRLCAELDAAIRSADDAGSRLARKIECVVRPQPPQVNEAADKHRGAQTQLGDLLQRFITQVRATANNLNSLADSVEL